MQQGLVEFGWTFVFTIINFLVIFYVLRRLLFKPITAFMENRRKGIEDSIKNAEDKNKAAEALKAEYEKKIEDIKEERDALIKEATKRAEVRSSEIIKAAEEQAKKIVERGHQDLEREKQKAVNELKDQISTLAIMAATKVVEEELDAKAHEKMIENFITEVGETPWQN